MPKVDGFDGFLRSPLIRLPTALTQHSMEQIWGVLRLSYNDVKSNYEMSLTAKWVQVRESIPEPPRISQKENGHDY